METEKDLTVNIPALIPLPRTANRRHRVLQDATFGGRACYKHDPTEEMQLGRTANLGRVWRV